MTPGEFIARQIRRRKAGKIVPPCVTARGWHTLPVTTRYRKPGPTSQWSLGYHTGEDHAAPEGSLAIATSWGRVVCVATWTGPGQIWGRGEVVHWGDSYGTHVIVRTGDGRYDYAACHLRTAMVDPGERVTPGTILGLTGHTGGSGSFGPHLHLEARPAGGRFGSDIDPINVKRAGVRTT